MSRANDCTARRVARRPAVSSMIGAMLAVSLSVADARPLRIDTVHTDERGRASIAQVDAVQDEVHSNQVLIASKRTKDVVIKITSAAELSEGDNGICVIFQTTRTNAPVDMREVTVEFSLLVGKIQERPISAVLNHEGTGRSCGHINLGRLYYSPSNYYVFVRYVDTGEAKRRTRLFVSVK